MSNWLEFFLREMLGLPHARLAALVLLAIVLLVWGALEIHSMRSIRASLEAVARQFGGRVVYVGWLLPHSVVFRAHGAEARLTYARGGRYRNPWVFLHFKCSGNVWMRICAEDPVTFVRKIFGAQDLRTGDDQFDRLFLIQGNPPEVVLRFLNRPGRELVLALDRLGTWRGHLRIDLNPYGFRVRVGGGLYYSPESLLEFSRLSVKLFGHLLAATGSAEITFKEAQVKLDGAACPVCGAPLDGKFMNCKKCRTPHHSECWRYYGGCAMYGCGSGTAVKG